MGYQLASYTGPEAKDVIIQWVKEIGLTKDMVKILQDKQTETVWVEAKFAIKFPKFV